LINRAFWLLVLLYFLTRLPWLFMVPMVEAPDEFSHFWVIKFLLDHNMRLPEYSEIIAGGPSGVYGSLPQMGYIPHVIAGAVGHVIAPNADLSLTERFGSLFTGLVLLWCSSEFGRKLFGADKMLSLALPLMVIFHPQLVLLHSYANSDSTTASLSAGIMLLVCRMMENGLKTKYSLWLGLLLGWVILTKYPGVSVYPSCAIGFVLAAWLNRQSLKTLLAQAFLTAATTAAASVWWFVRSARILSGDFLGTKTMFHTWAVTYNKPLDPDFKVWAIIKNHRWWRMTTWSYWGQFGYMTRDLPHAFYYIYMGFMYTAAGGAILRLALPAKNGDRKILSPLSSEERKGRFGLARAWIVRAACIIPNIAIMEYARTKNALKTSLATLKNSPALSSEERKARFGQAGIWIVLAACFLTNVSLMVYAQTKNLGGAQGRYLFPSEIPIIALILGGLYLTGEKARKPLILTLVAFNVIVYFYSCWMLSHVAGYCPHWLKTY